MAVADPNQTPPPVDRFAHHPDQYSIQFSKITDGSYTPGQQHPGSASNGSGLNDTALNDAAPEPAREALYSSQSNSPQGAQDDDQDSRDSNDRGPQSTYGRSTGAVLSQQPASTQPNLSGAV